MNRSNMRIIIAFFAMAITAGAATPQQVAEWLCRTHGIADAIGGAPPSVVMQDGRIINWPFAFERPADGDLVTPDAAEAWRAAQPVTQSVGQATVKTYADGTMEIVGALLIPGASNRVYEVTIDGDTGLMFGELDHASPRKSKAEKDAAKAARKAKIAAVKKATSRNEKVDALLDLLGLK